MARSDWYCEDVLSGELAVNLLFEDDSVIAFHHPYVCPPPRRRHPEDARAVTSCTRALDGNLLSSMLTAVQHAARQVELDADDGFYLRANAAAPGVTPHMH